MERKAKQNKTKKKKQNPTITKPENFTVAWDLTGVTLTWRLDGNYPGSLSSVLFLQP